MASQRTNVFADLPPPVPALCNDEHRLAALYRYGQAVERANRAKDEFMAALSHEPRTPLSSILRPVPSPGGEPAGAEAQHA